LTKLLGNETPTPDVEPQLYVGVDGVEVRFPDGFWDDPTHDLVMRGRPRREWIIDNVALAIAGGLRQALADRRPPASALVGPDGRPV